MKKAVLALSVWSVAASAAIGFVQGCGTYGQTPASIFATLISPNLVHDVIIVSVFDQDQTTNTLNAPTDYAGNTYHLINSTICDNGTGFCAMYYAWNIVAMGANSNSVHVSATTSGDYLYMQAVEESGVAFIQSPLDQSATMAQSALANNSIGPVMTLSAAEVVVSFAVATTTFSPGSGYTNRAGGSIYTSYGTGTANFMETTDNVNLPTNGPGSYSALWTNNASTTFGGIAAAFMAPPKFSLVQDPHLVCGSALTCTMTIASPVVPGPHDVGIIVAEGYAGSAKISSVSGGGTWVVPSTCFFAQSATVTASCAYNLSLSATTSVVITWSTSTPGTDAEADFREYTYSGYSVMYDTSNAIGQATTQYPLGTPLTLGGADDLIVQGLGTHAGHATAITSYGNAVEPAYLASADLLDTSSGAAPTWTLTATEVSAATAIALTGTPVPVAGAQGTGFIVLN